jgi:hypothetical protein
VGDPRKPKAQNGAKAAGPRSPRVQAAQHTRNERAPRARPPAERQDGHPRFSFVFADHEYEGSWRWFKDGEAVELLKFMIEVERLTWQEVHAHQAGGRRRLQKHHAQAIETLCTEAQDRLGNLRNLEGLVDDELYRFRLSGPHRLWGIRVLGDDTFYVLWWDPDHQVYPTERD